MPSYFITHPEVDVDPYTPIEEWNLSDVGRARAARLASVEWANQLGRIITSTEQKAMEAGAILSGLTGLTLTTRTRLYENDRSSTGFLPPAEFEATADQFFAHPNLSVRGWETAAQAQRRIVAAVRQLSSDPLFQSHLFLMEQWVPCSTAISWEYQSAAHMVNLARAATSSSTHKIGQLATAGAASN